MPRSARRGAIGVAAVVGVAAALALTHPLALHLRSAFLEDGSYDAYQFAWNLWWARESLVHLHASPFFTRYLFYPDGIGLLFHTFSFPLGLASVPLQSLPGGVVTAQNLLVIAAPALTVLFTALLAQEAVGDRWAALGAGLVAAVNPIAIWFLPIVYLHCGYFIAAVLWLWWRMQRRRRALDGILVLALLVITVFASQEYGMMVLALLALDALGRLAAPRALGFEPAWRAGTLGVWGVALGGGVALVALALGAPAEPPPLVHLLLGSGYAAGLVTPPWLVPPFVRFWSLLYLGTVPLLLLPVAVAVGGRRSAYWVLALVATAAMALGPRLNLHHPAADLRIPPDLETRGIPGPYLLALHLVPILRFFRAPYRWLTATQIMLALTTALALAGLRAHVVRPAARSALTAGLLALVVAGAALDVRGLRAPLARATVPRAYDVVRDDPQPCAVLDLPTGFAAGTFALFSSRYMYYQTAHRKFLLDGTVSRLPRGRLFAWQREFTDFAALPYVKYVVVHRDLLPAAYPDSRQKTAQIDALAERQGSRVVDTEGTVIYRLRTFRAENVR